MSTSVELEFSSLFLGVHDADPNVRFGAPGGSCRLTGFSKLCWALIDHVTRGRNYFSGKTGTRLDYFSFHSKGGKQSEGNSTILYFNEKLIIGNLHRKYKTLRNISIYNDESDPVTGWSKPLEFRADTRYPAMVVKLLAKHLLSQDKEFSKFVMSSNDNAFINYAPHYFTQRTLFATFLVNNTQHQYAVLVQKPIFSLIAMLSQVRGRILPTSFLRRSGNQAHGFIETFSSHQHMITFWTSNDTRHCNGSSMTYSIKPPISMRLGWYVIRKLHNPAYDIWKQLGAPGNLSRPQTEILWNVTSVTSTKPAMITTETIQITMDGREGVKQLLMCNGYEKLTPPKNMTFHHIAEDMVLISWSDEAISDCFQSYELQLRRRGAKDFITVNNNIVLTRYYQYTSMFGVCGDYRIASRNILGQISKFSETFRYVSRLGSITGAA